MKIMTIQVPDDSVEFVEELVERIGGNVGEREANKHEKKKQDKSSSRKVKPLDFFGTWTDINLDPETYRNKLWRKTPQL